MLIRSIIIVILVISSAYCQGVQSGLYQSINNMVGQAVNVDALVTFTADHGQFISAITNLRDANTDFARDELVKHVNWRVKPFAKFRPLLFGSGAKVSTLTYHTSVNAGGNGNIVANAILGVRIKDRIEMISAYGVVLLQPKQQYNVQTVNVCKKTIKTSCHLETVKTPRGFYSHEIENIIQEGQRRAAIAMRNSIPPMAAELETRLSLQPLSSLASVIHTEHRALRTLYPEIQYDYEDYTDVASSKWNEMLTAGMRGLGDQTLRDRIHQFMTSTGHSNFLWAVDSTHLFYLIIHNGQGGLFNLHVRHFIVGANGRLPVGAFASSVGSWRLERPGEGASPSINQLLSIFSYK